jgi:hypothetical protein
VLLFFRVEWRGRLALEIGAVALAGEAGATGFAKQFVDARLDVVDALVDPGVAALDAGALCGAPEPPPSQPFAQ